MKIKVCGMRDEMNIRELVRCKPDYIGFIFYEGSKRYVGKTFDAKIMDLIPLSIEKVGVFVDCELGEVVELVTRFGLDVVQLHGNECADYCRELRGEFGVGSENVALWKALAGDAGLKDTAACYEGVVDCLLVDTPTKEHGGSGKKFDWKMLEKAGLKTPFFLSGGIGVEDVDEIFGLDILMMQGVDVNSKFEVFPGLKDVSKTGVFINKVRHGKKQV